MRLRGTSCVGAEISRIKADIAQRYSRLLQMVVSAGVLEASEVRRYEPVVVLDVEDRRGRR
jgi:hypothetical protein